jgi:hypothetical protein
MTDHTDLLPDFTHAVTLFTAASNEFRKSFNPTRLLFIFIKVSICSAVIPYIVLDQVSNPSGTFQLCT